MSKRLRINYPLFLSDFNETWIFSTDFRKKNTSIKFHQNSSSGSRVQTERRTDRQTDMTKLTVAFHNFVNATTNVACIYDKGFLAFPDWKYSVNAVCRASPVLWKQHVNKHGHFKSASIYEGPVPTTEQNCRARVDQSLILLDYVSVPHIHHH
jgi:hypothetical protein